MLRKNAEWTQGNDKRLRGNLPGKKGDTGGDGGGKQGCKCERGGKENGKEM